MKNKALHTAVWLGWPVALIGLIALFWTFTGEKNRVGSRLYEIHCANCHMEEGQGLRGLIPPLAAADYVQSHGADMACLIVYGIDQPMTVNGRIYRQPMPGNDQLRPKDIAEILNFVRNSWGNETEEMLNSKEIDEALKDCNP